MTPIPHHLVYILDVPGTGTAGVATGPGPVTTGLGGGAHRGPIRATQDVFSGTAGGATAGVTDANTTGYGGGMNPTGVPGTAAGAGVRPPAGQRIMGEYHRRLSSTNCLANYWGAGEAEKLAGHVVGNPAMVANGQQKKVCPHYDNHCRGC